MSSKPAAPSRASVTAWAQDVGVGVAGEASFEGDLYAAQDEPAVLFQSGEGMYVHAQADPEAQRRTPPRVVRIASASTRSSGEVSFTLVFSPATMPTRPPSFSTSEASSVAARSRSSEEA